MITSQEIGELAAAMAKAQAAIENPVKEKENAFFKNNRGVAARYADLAMGLDCIRPALSAQSIAVFQVTSVDRENNLILRTRLVHGPSGQWIESEYLVGNADLRRRIKDRESQIEIETADIDHQKIGSALTYAKRQSLFALVGIAGADDDDDGNSANANGNSAGGEHAAITNAQAQLIRDKIASTNADLTKFLAFFKVESIGVLRSSQFREAMTLLNAKKISAKEATP